MPYLYMNPGNGAATIEQDTVNCRNCSHGIPTGRTSPRQPLKIRYECPKCGALWFPPTAEDENERLRQVRKRF